MDHVKNAILDNLGKISLDKPIIVSWSGGKDSTATIILCYEFGIPISCVCSEVMFDHARNISGEHPLHATFIHYAKEKIESDFGIPVHLLRDASDYVTEFHRRIHRSKIEMRNNKKQGFLIGGMCVANSRLKMRPLNRFFKELGEHISLVGICADETDRLLRLQSKPNTFSLLSALGINKADTAAICSRYNLLSPIYRYGSRQGCWFCPNASYSSMAKFKKDYPLIWGELHNLSMDPDLVSYGFKYGKTIQEVDTVLDYINSMPNQLSFFEVCDYE